MRMFSIHPVETVPYFRKECKMELGREEVPRRGMSLVMVPAPKTVYAFHIIQSLG